MEISQYYGKNLTPEDEFGRQLFDDWDLNDFQKFDNYIVNCVQLFLNNGLISQNAKNLKLRKFIAETSMDFFEWIEDIDNFPLNKNNSKVEVFDKFILEYKDYNWLKRKTFIIWVQKYAKYKGYDFEQGNSNGVRWYSLIDKNKPIIEDEVEF